MVILKNKTFVPSKSPLWLNQTTCYLLSKTEDNRILQGAVKVTQTCKPPVSGREKIDCETSFKY